MENKFKFKKFLATASAFAMITGASSAAMGAARATTGANTSFGVGGNVAFNNGDNIEIANAAHTNISTASPLVFGNAVNLNNIYDGNTGTLTANHNITFGAFDNTIKLVVDEGHSDLTGQNSLENVTVNGGRFTAQDLTGAGAGDGDLIVNNGVATVRDVAGAVTLTAGKLTMNDATGAHAVTVNGGELTINNVANNLAVNTGTVTQTGTVGGTLGVANGGLYVGGAGADIAGAVTINTANAGMNKLHNAANTVTLTAGKLTMNDATGAHAVTVNGGELTINNVAGNVAVDNGAMVTIGRDVRGNIDGNDNSTITLGSGTTTGDVVKGQNIIVTGNRTFDGTWEATNLQVDGDNTLKFTNPDADIGATDISTTATNKVQNFEVASDQNITRNWGTAANPLGNLHVTDANKGKDITITIDTANSHISVTTKQADTTNIAFKHAAGGELRSIGANGVRINSTTFNENGKVSGGTNSKTIAVTAGKKAILGGKIKGVNLTLNGAGSALDLEDGFILDTAILDTAIIAGNAGEGVVEFLGGGSIEAGKNIYGVKTVTFSDTAGKVLTVSANITAAEKIDLGKATFKTGSADVTLSAPDVNAANASFDLATGRDIRINRGNVTFSGTEGKIAVTVMQSGNELQTGQIIADAGATLKYDNGAKVTITPDDSNGNRPAGGASRTFTLIANDTNNAAVGTLLVDIDQSKNPFTKWTSKSENGSLILTQIDGAKDKIIETLGSDTDAVTRSNFEKLSEALPGTDGANIINVVAGIFNDKSLSTAQIKEKTQELNDRLTPISTATDSIETTMSNASSAIGTRVISVAKPAVGTSVQSRAVASEKVSGVAAGDDHARYGAWFSPFFSKTTQKARKGAAGYKDTSYGGSFGMDTKANDDLVIGGAVTFANSEMKHRDFKSGDKTKVNSLMFSIYGLQNITDTWFAQGAFSIASNDVKNSERKVAASTAYETTDGKYNSMSFAGDVLFGYNYAVEGFNLTPMGGLKYTRVNSAGYKTSGSATGQNANISQKPSNKLEVVVGARASGGTFDVNGMSVTPEVHGFINHDLIGKNPKQDIRIGGVSGSLDAKSRKPIRTSYNLGLGVNANYGMMEYGAGYDLHLADKRVGHEGSLKVRVNF